MFVHLLALAALFLGGGTPLAPAAVQDFRDDSSFEALWTPFEGTRPAHWRVVWHGDPCRTASVCWSTRAATTDTRLVLVGPRSTERDVEAPDFDAAIANSTAQRFQPTSWPYTPGEDEGTAPLGHAHVVRLTDLEPGARYDLVIESGAERTRPLHFLTAPRDGTEFEILYGGDSRTGWRDRCRVNLMIAELATSDAFPLCFVHGGDYVENGGRSAEWMRWLSHHELTTARDGRVLPVLPARGNHDWGPCYAEVFDRPGRTGDRPGAWFRTDLGSDVAILHLDTNVPALGDQFVWMGEQLPAARASADWLLVNYHRPMFPAVKEPSGAAPYWVPTFERHDVDLVFESDGHVMKRTVPVRAGQPDPSGVTYIGEGGLGVPQRIPRSDHWYFDGGFTGRGHHVSLVRFEAERAVARFVVLDAEYDGLSSAEPLVPFDSSWRFLAGSDPDPEWTRDTFDDAAWPEGRAGFGYGDDDDTTVLDDMHGAYTRVHLRARFDVDVAALDENALLLAIDHDDGFVAWLNGVEVARSAVAAGSGPSATGVSNHEAGTPTVVDLSRFESLLRPTANVLAVEGHNLDADSSDFSLHPGLFLGRAPSEDPTAVSYGEVDACVLERRTRVR